MTQTQPNENGEAVREYVLLQNNTISTRGNAMKTKMSRDRLDAEIGRLARLRWQPRHGKLGISVEVFEKAYRLPMLRLREKQLAEWAEE